MECLICEWGGKKPSIIESIVFVTQVSNVEMVKVINFQKVDCTSHAIEIVLVHIGPNNISSAALRKCKVETCDASPSPSPQKNRGENALFIFFNVAYSVVRDAE